MNWFNERAQNIPNPTFAVPPENAINFLYGFADPSMFPSDAIAAATAASLKMGVNAVLNYAPPPKSLTDVITGRLRKRGVIAGTDEILLSYGSTEALHIIPQICIIPGDTIVIEAPTFLGAVSAFVQSGARLVTIPVDEHGMKTTILEETLSNLRSNGIHPKFIYTIPTFQNPTGTTLSLQRREHIIDLASMYEVMIVEDDAYAELGFSGEEVPPLAALNREWVISLGSFSKILAPGLRLGWVIARPEIIQRLAFVRSVGACGPFVAHTAAMYCVIEDLDKHIVHLCDHYRNKRDIMLESIKKHFPSDVKVWRPEGGFFIWCELPPGVSAQMLLQKTAARNVIFMPGTNCFHDGRGDDAIRLAFSCIPEQQIMSGIFEIGEVLRLFC